MVKCVEQCNRCIINRILMPNIKRDEKQHEQRGLKLVYLLIGNLENGEGLDLTNYYARNKGCPWKQPFRLEALL